MVEVPGVGPKTCVEPGKCNQNGPDRAWGGRRHHDARDRQIGGQGAPKRVWNGQSVTKMGQNVLVHPPDTMMLLPMAVVPSDRAPETPI